MYIEPYAQTNSKSVAGLVSELWPSLDLLELVVLFFGEHAGGGGGGEHSRDFSDAAAMIIQLHGIVDWLSDLAVVLVDHMHPTLNTVQISVDMDGTIFKL